MPTPGDLTNEIGLHARPAALLARTLADVDAEVTVRFGDSEADGASVLALMALGARRGDEMRSRRWARTRARPCDWWATWWRTRSARARLSVPECGYGGVTKP